MHTYAESVGLGALVAAGISLMGCGQADSELPVCRDKVARIGSTGASLNGVSLNGTTENGTSFNGTTLNGVSINGASFDGTTANRVLLDGTELRLDTDGPSIAGTGIVGTILTGERSDGSDLALRIDSA